MVKAVNLDYASAPRPGLVFGCLMPAPWLGVVAGLLLLLGPVDALPDRFAPLALAAVHALALGMLLPVMLGALFQMMPVVAGVSVPFAGLVSPFVAAAGAGTAAALAAGFLGSGVTAFRWAVATGGTFLTLAGLLLLAAGLRVAAVDATTRTLAWIGAPLIVTALGGAALAGLFGGMWAVAPEQVLALHVAWGLGGWLAALVSGVATTVLPMFWQTERLPSWLERCLPYGHWLLLLVFSIVVIARPGGAVERFALVPWLLFAMVLGTCALKAAWRARRRHDPQWVLWPVSALSLLLAALLTTASALMPNQMPAAAQWCIGVLALVGGGVLPVNAMLGKIVPFLVWLHLRRLLPPRARVPAMQVIISPDSQKRQGWMVLAAFLVLLAVPLAPGLLAKVGGVLFAITNGWLGVQLLRALRCMRVMRKQGGLPPRVAAAVAEHGVPPN
ncbi:MAG: hypothetical protein COC14_00435 [Burkholderiaceae bacterium]|jgi:hypothetical protein|uniref:Transmembrane protein n=1 Tax=Cupriavidus metallidurans TaxID=119219 RepID=A0A482IN59_9BURK|nr:MULTISPECIES: hypothetical protein [Cupriavidus]KWR81911.1 hypothetical protein RN01_13880 [Cupriavidus sp. SHE]PCH58812.1 MAG: hypothetical protein COC14_00435 [Burkholderiaceae bacterium]QBP10258.1 hypothetical protein DDF84_011075 [Cupriavidus metallidurans]QWC87333.1 hypothetical protein KB891_09620 [Cupriavidus metallidurans]